MKCPPFLHLRVEISSCILWLSSFVYLFVCLIHVCSECLHSFLVDIKFILLTIIPLFTKHSRKNYYIKQVNMVTQTIEYVWAQCCHLDYRICVGSMLSPDYRVCVDSMMSPDYRICVDSMLSPDYRVCVDSMMSPRP